MSDATPESLAARPRDLALLLLAQGGEPPRQRARDQQADRAGGALRLEILNRLIAIDPEPNDCAAALDGIVTEVGEPSGPTRAVASTILQEWRDAMSTPGLWSWLLEQALEQSQAPRRKRGRREADGTSIE
jgi:hypothetical protein